MRHVVRAGDATAWLSPRILARLPVAVLLAQAVQLIAVVLAIFKRSVTWRGATYHIAGPFDVRLLRNPAAETPPQSAVSNMSL